jgi:hypothetical protein
VEARDHGVEHEADVRPGGHDLSRIVPASGQLNALTARNGPIEAAQIAASMNSIAQHRASERQTPQLRPSPSE